MPNVTKVTDPVGTVNGSNRDFSTPSQYASGTLFVLVNGIWVAQGADNGWTEIGPDTFRMNVAPPLGYVLQVAYKELT